MNYENKQFVSDMLKYLKYKGDIGEGTLWTREKQLI